MLLLRWPSLHLCARCRFLEKLPPKLPFDGELWVGRRRFQETVRIVNGPAIGDGWRRVEFHVFDCPVCVYVRVRVCFVKAQAPTTHRVGCQTLDAPFETRIAAVTQWAKQAKCHVKAVPQRKCESADHLQQALLAAVADHGEGLMLRQPGSRFVCGSWGAWEPLLTPPLCIPDLKGMPMVGRIHVSR